MVKQLLNMKNVPKPEPHDLKIGRSRLKPTPQEPIQNFKRSFVSKLGPEVRLKYVPPCKGLWISLLLQQQVNTRVWTGI